jgi:antitoxin component of MazEF toxin-antitoxin module
MKIKKYGNSFYLNIPSKIVKNFDLEDMELKLTVKKKGLWFEENGGKEISDSKSIGKQDT